MANFDKEFEKLIPVEGGYVFDPDDAGGETYMGISRKNNPKWYGWNIIDKIKKTTNKNDLTKVLKQNKELTNNVKVLYKDKYWDVLELDDIKSQDIAHQLFDTCVNCGKATAIRIAQKTLNMTVDGKWSEALKYNINKYEK